MLYMNKKSYFCRPILKQRSMKQFFVLFIAMFALLIPHACNVDVQEDNKNTLSTVEVVDRSFDRIQERGKLIATTDYNSTNYFIYRGEPAGYEYEMLRAYAKHIGVELELVVNHDFEDAYQDLVEGKVDLIAMGLTVNSQRKTLVDFTEPLGETRQVLVQRKPEKWRRMNTMSEVDEHLVRNPLELAGKMIYIPRHSPYGQRLRNLQHEIGDSIYVVEFPQTSERLIEMVAKGEIDYTVSDEHVALVNQKYFPDIDVSTPLSFPLHVAWGVKKEDDSLTANINAWIKEFGDSKIARFIYNKYFINPRSLQYAHKYYSVRSGKISTWDDLLKEKSKDLAWDWRLIASLIYQESRFQPEAISWMGAFGLMQLMPGTAELYGVDSMSPPEENIRAGIHYLKFLDERFSGIIENPEERRKFVLAAYNVGIAHVFDARRLAEKYGRDPNVWDDNVAFFLLNKSDPKYYNDSVVYYGYCRGEEPYNYVNDILYRYEHYRNVIED